MASSALRAAQIMRSLPLSGTWKQTSRMMSASIHTRCNIIFRHGSINDQRNAVQRHQDLASLTSFQLPRYNTTAAAPSPPEESQRTRRPPDVSTLDRTIDMFEEKCQRLERVDEKDFVKTFNMFTRVVDELREAGSYEAESNITQYSATLLRCCGRLMFETPPKGRELLAGNLWTYIKDKKIPLDISHFNSLIRVMNENETVYDPQKILDEIEQNQFKPDRITYQRLIHQYCAQGDITNATKLLEVMKDEGVELNEAIFASLIIGYSKQENPPTIADMFALMRENEIEPGTKSYTAAVCALGDRFAKDPEAAAAELTKIIELIKKDEIQFSANDYTDLIHHLGPHKDAQPVVGEFFDRYINNIFGTIASRYRMLSSLFRVNQKDYASHLFWSQSVSERAIQSGNVGSYYVRAMARHFNLPVDFVMNECLKLIEKRWNPKALHSLYYISAECGNLKLTRAAMKKMTENEPMKVIYVWPLLAQAEKDEDIIKVLKEDLDPKLGTTELLETFSLWVWPRFANDPNKLFKLNKEELNYEANILVASYLNYSVQENKIPEAIKFISEAPQSLIDESSKLSEAADDENDDSKLSVTPRRSSDRGDLIARLLFQIAEQTKDPELVMKAFNMCQLPNQQVSNRSLGALIRVHLLNDDFNGALEQFLKICKEYRMTPNRRDLMKHCLVNKDPESLQKIMNSVSEIYGEANSLFDLAVCCLWANKLKQAHKIFASPGFRVRPVRVYQACKSIARTGNITVLENFVNLARDMYDINQEYLYQVLIETYDRTSNAKRALNLWNIMQEEEFQPSKKSLVLIAELLEKNNIQVPFQKPISPPRSGAFRAQRDA